MSKNKDLKQLRHRWRSGSTATEGMIDALIDEVEKLRADRSRGNNTPIPVPGFALGRNGCPTAQPEPEEWTKCLERLDTRPFGVHVRATWQELQQALGPGLPLPQVNLNVADGDAYGSDADVESADVVTLSWSQDVVYAEIEIFEDGSREWFIRHRKTGDYAGSNGWETALPLDVRLLQMLFLITPKVLNLSPLYHIGSDTPIHAPALGSVGKDHV